MIMKTNLNLKDKLPHISTENRQQQKAIEQSNERYLSEFNLYTLYIILNGFNDQKYI